MMFNAPRFRFALRRSSLAAACTALLISACQSAPDAAPGAAPAQAVEAANRENWVASWASSPSTRITADDVPAFMRAPELDGTVRYLMRVSAGGERVRIVLDGGPTVTGLSIGAATVALAGDSGVDTETVRQLTFSGRPDIAPATAGAPIWSDPVALPVSDGSVLAVSLYLREPIRVPTADPQLTVEVAPGDDQTRAAVLSGATRLVARPLVAAVHVDNPAVSRVVVALGDSITDGTGSTDPLMRGWPDFLAQRLREEGLTHVAIANHGIGGNRLLRESVGPSALTRFDRDVLGMPGVTDLILLEGINDLGLSGVTMPWGSEPYPVLEAGDIIGAYEQIIVRARAHGIRVIGATLTPALGVTFPGYSTPEKNVIRQEINEWIRTSGAFDAVIDFDAAIRDPENPDYLLPAYDVGDRIHPSDAGYKAMADAIDLSLFR